MAWINYLHSIIMPNPAYMVNINENDAFSDHDNQAIGNLISKIMVLASRNVINGIKKENEKDYINKSVLLWKEILPELVKITEKANKKWVKYSKSVQ
jgi:hypothetical protein